MTEFSSSPDVLYVNIMETSILRQLRGTRWTSHQRAVGVIKSALAANIVVYCLCL